MEMNLTGYQMVAGMAVICLLIIAIIALVKWYWSRSIPRSLDESITYRTKYKSIDFLRCSKPFLNMGMVLALALVALAFSWTTYEPNRVVEYTYHFEEDLETIPPVVFPERKHIPPPKALKNIEIIGEPISEVEAPELLETEIEATPISPHAIAISKPVISKTKPKPPVVLPEPTAQPEFVIRAAEMPRLCTSCDTKNMSRAERNKCAGMELLKEVQRHLKYPSMARENRVEGLCAIQFRVTAEGKLSHIKILKDIGAGCGQAALKALESFNHHCWHPGRQNGRAVAVQMTLPIRFKLE